MLTNQARNLLRRQHSVLWVDHSKRPLTSNGANDATNVESVLDMLGDAAQSSYRWSLPPSDDMKAVGYPQCAIRPGLHRPNPYVVLDYDPRSDPTGETLRRLTAAGISPTTTFTVSTQGGGFHFYTEAHDNVRSCKPAPGLDVIGATGYVLAPGCEGYEPVPNTPPILLPYPAEFIALLERKRSEERGNRALGEGASDLAHQHGLDIPAILGKAPHYQGDPEIRVPKGARDATAFAIACRLRGDDLPQREAAEILGRIWENQFDDHETFPPQQLLAKLQRAYTLYEPDLTPAGRAWAAQEKERAKQNEPGTTPAEYDDTDSPMLDGESFDPRRQHPATDAGFVDRLFDRYPDKILYSTSVADGFYTYDETTGTWHHDRGQFVQQAIIDTAIATFREEYEWIPEDERKAFNAYCLKYQNNAGIRMIMNMLERDSRTNITEAEWDSNPRYLATRTGVIDLDDYVWDEDEDEPYPVFNLAGTAVHPVRDFSPAFRMRKRIPASPCGQFDMPGTTTWQSYLDSTLPDPDVQRYVQAAIGSALSGKGAGKNIFFLVGPNDTSKSTFISAMQVLFGEFATTLSADTVIQTRKFGDADNKDLVDLPGARFAFVAEVPPKALLDSSKLKALASSDKHRAARKYGQPFEFVNRAALFIPLNILAGVNDPSLWSRARVIPFTRVIPDHERISEEQILEMFRFAADEIFNWALEGRYLSIHGNALKNVPQAVLNMTRAWRDSEDWCNAFLNEQCSINPALKVGATELYLHYLDWHAGESDRGDPVKQREFGIALNNALGTKLRRRKSNGIQYHGLALKPEGTRPALGGHNPLGYLSAGPENTG